MKTPLPELLLIDVGNTRTKWAIGNKHGTIRVAGDIPTTEVTPRWTASLARRYFRGNAILASVVPKVRPSFRRAFGARLVEVSSTLLQLGFGFQYPKPAELGADRLAAAVAAHARGDFPAIIVSCGTATAFTVLDSKGRLCGGAIAPGLEAQLHALLGATAQLPSTSLRMPANVVARSTKDAIRAGVMLSFQGGVKEILRQLSQSLPSSPRILLTGGNAKHLVEHLEVPFKLRPLLVFEGLLIIGARLSKPDL